MPTTLPDWVGKVVDLAAVRTDAPFMFDLRSVESETASQTADTFSFKWSQNDTFSRTEFRRNSGEWYVQKYGPLTDDAWWAARPARPLVIEIGPGSGISAEYLVGARLPGVDYLGVDISTSIVTANECLRGLGGDPYFLQADILDAPVRPGVADLVFSEGVLHHTDNTEAAVRRAASLVAPGGRLAFYVYKKKAACREFTDDHIRALIADLPAQEAWDVLMPLTKLGRSLGELGVTVDVDEPVDVLGIPAGSYDIQRFFYWFFFKAYYRPEFTLDEMNHINFDWYTPKNCFRHEPDEVRSWFDGTDFSIVWFNVEEAGITVVADRAR